MSKRGEGKYRFHSFELDVPNRRFLKNGADIHLAPKEFCLLALLVENAGQLLDKETIIEVIWPDTYVEEGNISRHIHGLRKTLGQNLGSQIYIETVAKSGYRFLASVEQLGDNGYLASVVPSGIAVDLETLRRAVRSRDLEAGDRLASQYLEEATARGDVVGIAVAYRERALCHNLASNYLRSLEYAEKALSLLNGSDEPFLVGQIYSDIAQTNWVLRRHQESIRLVHEAIEIITDTGNVQALTFTLNNLAFFLLQYGEFEAAGEVLDKGLKLAEESDSVYAASILDTRAELSFRMGNIDVAIKWVELAIAKSREPNHRVGSNMPMRNLARCLLAKGRDKDAYQVAQEAIRKSEESGDRRYLTYSKAVLAEACLRLGGLAESERLLDEIDSEGMGIDFFVQGEVLRLKGLMALEVADYERSLGYFKRSRAVFEKDGDVYNTAVIDLALGNAYYTLERREGISRLKEAITAFDRLSNEILATAARSALSNLTEMSDLPNSSDSSQP